MVNAINVIPLSMKCDIFLSLSLEFFVKVMQERENLKNRLASAAVLTASPSSIDNLEILLRIPCLPFLTRW